MTQDRIALALSDEEFAAMMKEFDLSGEWMREQLASNRAASPPNVLNQSRADAAVRGRRVDPGQPPEP